MDKASRVGLNENAPRSNIRKKPTGAILLRFFALVLACMIATGSILGEVANSQWDENDQTVQRTEVFTEEAAEDDPLTEEEAYPQEEPETYPQEEPEHHPEAETEAYPPKAPEEHPEDEAETYPPEEPEKYPEEESETYPQEEPEEHPEEEDETYPKEEPKEEPEEEAETYPKEEPEEYPEKEDETYPEEATPETTYPPVDIIPEATLPQLPEPEFLPIYIAVDTFKNISIYPLDIPHTITFTTPGAITITFPHIIPETYIHMELPPLWQYNIDLIETPWGEHTAQTVISITPYTPTAITITANLHGQVLVYPPSTPYRIIQEEPRDLDARFASDYFSLGQEVILVLLPPTTLAENITLNLPEYWDYQLSVPDTTDSPHYTVVALLPNHIPGIYITVAEDETVTVYPPGLDYIIIREDWYITIQFSHTILAHHFDLDIPSGWHHQFGALEGWDFPCDLEIPYDDDYAYPLSQALAPEEDTAVDGTIISIVPMVSGFIDYQRGGFTVTLGQTLELGPNAVITGHITVPNGSTLIVNGATIRSATTHTNLTAQGGSTVHFNSGDLGGTLNVENGATVTMGTPYGGQPRISRTFNNGHGVVIFGGGELTMYDGLIHGNTATTAQGGGVRILDGGLFTMHNGSIENNTTTETNTGGGIFINGINARFFMHGGRLYNNTAGGSGGGIHIAGGATVYIYNGTVDRNNASAGGGIHMNASTNRLFIGNAVISRNIARTGTGGGVNAPEANNQSSISPIPSVQSPQLTITSNQTGTLENPGTANAGGINLAGETVFNFPHVYISDNEAFSAGGLQALNNVQINVDHITIHNNRAHNQGGGIVLQNNATLTVGTLATITNNVILEGTTGGSAGGVHLGGSSTFTIPQGAYLYLAHNHSRTTGGGINTYGSPTLSIYNGTIYNNIAGTHGGGIHADGHTHVTLTHATLDNNTATTGTGGGINIGTNAQVTMHEGIFVNNHAESNGGGLHISSILQGNHSRFTALATESNPLEFNNNTAGTNGGGLHATSASTSHTTVSIPYSIFYNNQAQSAGGGINATGLNTTVTLSHAIVSHNQSGLGDTGDGTGGGINHIHSTFTMSSGDISNNISHRGGGGGISSSSGVLNLPTGVNIRDNTAHTGYGYVTVQNELERQSQAGSGGGIRLQGNNLPGSGVVYHIGSLAITNNTAQGIGGGMHIGGGITLTLTHMEITDNRAADSGGGISTGEGTTLTLTDSHVLRNGFVANHQDIMPFAAVDINHHSALEDLTPPLTATTIATQSGGGVLAGLGSRVYITDTYIWGNSAVANGGGISALQGAHITITGATIANNRAFNQNTGGGTGGGLHAFGTHGTFGHVHLTISDTIINNNRAGGNGAGIQTGNTTALTLTNSYVTNNRTVTSQGGGMNLGTNSTTTITDTIIAVNVSNDSGGGINIFNENATLYLHGHTQITGNISLGHGGGGIFASNPPVQNPLGSTVTMYYPATIHNNQALGDHLTPNGGGVRLLGHATFHMRGGAIFNNFAAQSGGGVNAGGNSEFIMYYPLSPGLEDRDITMVPISSPLSGFTLAPIAIPEGLSIFGNIAAQNGGGILLGGAATSTIGGLATIYDNHAHGATAIAGLGGGIVLSENNTLTMSTGTLLCSNTAREGGGMHIHAQSIFVMEGGRIRNNHTTTLGGAPGRTGGGVRMIGTPRFYFTGGIIHANSALTTGGGVSAGDNSTLTMGGTAEIYNNTSRSGGGLIVTGNATATIGGHGQIHHNITHIFAGGFGTGGGIAMDITATVYITENAHIHNNHAPIDGGGIHVSGTTGAQPFGGATLHIHGGTIAYNTATRNGGGITIWLNGAVNMTGGTIQNNTAGPIGGGISLSSNQLATFYMSGGTITGNTAVSNGGGIGFSGAPTFVAVLNAQYQIAISPTSTTVAGNTAPHSPSEDMRDHHINRATNGVVPALGGVINPSTHGDTNGFNNMDIHTLPLFMVWVNRHLLDTDYLRYDNPNHGVDPPFQSGRLIRVYRQAEHGRLNWVFNGWTFYREEYQPQEVLGDDGELTIEMVPVWVPFVPNNLSNETNATNGRRTITFTMPEHDVRVYANWLGPLNFQKTDQRLYSSVLDGARAEDVYPFLLAGAVFHMYTFNCNNGTIPVPDELVTPDRIGNGPGYWRRLDVGTSTGVPGQALHLLLNPGQTNQLVEVSPPTGFDRPRGQWRMIANDEGDLVPDDQGLLIRVIGDVTSTPAFAWLYYECGVDGMFFVGNRPTLILPMSGGSGVSTQLQTLGLLSLSLSLGLLALMAVKRKRQVQQQ